MRGNKQTERSPRLTFYRGAWYATWIEDGQTKRRALRTKDRSVAEHALTDFRVAIEGPAETVGEIMQRFIADRESRKIDAAGRKYHERVSFSWKNLEPHFGNLRPKDVTRQACRGYTTERRRDASDGTIIKELSTLKAALRWYDRNTPAIVEMPPQPPPRDRYLTREEYRSLRDASRWIPHCELFVVLAYTTAGRAGAILELTWDRVDFDRGIIHLGEAVGTKGRATVPMTDAAREVLERARRAALSDHVIEYGGRPVKSIRNTFMAAAKRAGIEGVSPHVLRHTAAVHMAESGIPLTEIGQYLGHRNMTQTYRVYARYSPDYLRKAAGVLE